VLKELEDVMKLVAECEEEWQRKAVEALIAIVDEHEDWVSTGRPETGRWQLMKFVRDPRFNKMAFQKLVREMLKKGEL
jgi:hypothetical protein